MSWRQAGAQQTKLPFFFQLSKVLSNGNKYVSTLLCIIAEFYSSFSRPSLLVSFRSLQTQLLLSNFLCANALKKKTNGFLLGWGKL